MTTYLIIGLGNIGGRYAKTRHNMGFNVIDTLLQKYKATDTKIKHKAIYSIVKQGDKRLIFAKPTTYMNNSGEAVLELKQYYKVSLENLIIIYDDVDLPEGFIRVRAGGGAGTHNGMRSVLLYIDEGFPRVRVGIGKCDQNMQLADYVLSKLSPESQKVLDNAIVKAAEAVECFINEGIDKAMNIYNKN